MRWSKRGLIYCPDGKSDWAKHTALTPTPILTRDDVIRVFVSFRDDEGVGRIGFVDVDAGNPSRVLGVSDQPALDVGRGGTFDDNGVILGDIVPRDTELYLYYVGFQLVQKAKFLAFTGLAVSTDGGQSFARRGKTPVLDRSDEGIFIRAIHSVAVEDAVWKVWYAAGDGWEQINGRPYPQYHIRYLESRDGVHFPSQGQRAVDVVGSEYRIGRPRVFRRGSRYGMFYTRGTREGDYLAGYAESEDGRNWTRNDSELGISLSRAGWDSTSLCYPTILTVRDRVYLFYNGNDMGKTGFGYAVLEEW